MIRAPKLLFLLALLGAVPAFGCKPPRNAAAAELDALPEYKGKDTALFDDSMEASAVGLALDRPMFKGDIRFRDRAQSAGMIAKLKVTTVTIDKVEDRITYHLQLKLVGAPILGADKDEFIEITVKEGAPSFGLVNQVSTRFRDRTVIGMWKRFRENGEATLHFYLAPDDADAMAAVQEAVALSALKK